MKQARIRSSICDYLDWQSLDRLALRNTLDMISSNIPDTVIFGGMLREFAWGHARGFSSDIDLVCKASRADILSAIRVFSPKQNQFGGFRFIAGKRLFDIWALEDTWAFTAGIVQPGGFDALFDTTFFGVDSAYFHLKTRDYIFSADHEMGIRERLLDVNLQTNPSPKKMAARAIRMAIKADLAISSRLANYIVEHQPLTSETTLKATYLKALIKHLEKGKTDDFRFRPQLSAISSFETYNEAKEMGLTV